MKLQVDESGFKNKKAILKRIQCLPLLIVSS